MNIVEPTEVHILLAGIGVLGLLASIYLLWLADSANPDSDNPHSREGFYCCSSVILIIIPFLAFSQPSPPPSTPYLKSKNSDSLVLGEIKDDMSPEMKAFMGSYKDWKDDGGVIPENSDEILEEILENGKSDSSSNSRSKNCEHCGFSNSASNNPGWAGLLGMSSMLEGTAGCDISCINCGRNFWVSTKELTGSGPDVQFDSMPGIGDYIVNKMNKTAEERGDTARYELPTERAERKNRKKSPKSEK
mgnify:CR=1 FL=1